MLMEELGRAGRADDTLIIYLGDHGPQFSRGKGASYELAVKVPFMVRWPGAGAPGMVKERLVSSVDIMPTILEAAGVEPPDGLPGLSLRPLLDSDPEDWRSHLFCEWNTSHPYPQPSFLFPQRTIRDDRYKLILTLLTDQDNPVEEYYTQQVLVETGATQSEIDAAAEEMRRAYGAWRRPNEIELYDLESDPYEFHDLAAKPEHSQVKEELLDTLKRWLQESGDPLSDPDKLALLLAEDTEVRSLDGAHRSPEFDWRYVDYLYS